MVLHEELPIPVSSLLEPAYGQWFQHEELRSNEFQTLRNFHALFTSENSSGSPIGIPENFVVFLRENPKLNNVAYMKMKHIREIMNCEQNPIGPFTMMFKKSCHVMVNDKLFVKVQEDDTMNEGIIALDAMQCEFANISNGDSVSVQLFVPTIELNMAELKVVVYKLDKGVKINYDALQLELRDKFKQDGFKNQIMCMDQKVLFHTGAYFKVTCIRMCEQSNECDNVWGKIKKATTITIRRPKVFSKEIQMRNIEETLISLGIGGIGPTFQSIIQKAFASRFLSPTFCKRLNINHVKGMVLYGPPGTGKTLLMRKLAELLDAVEPKVVNGPELLVKWAGESEQNVRSLFSEARKDYEDNGDNSSLHIIIFDELDSIARRRGQSTQSEMRDGIVNQLLTMIDGFSGINNIFIVGTTNRLDLIDSALLRPGRLELLLEVGAPDEEGRLQILKVHTQNLKTSLLESDVDLKEIASLTPNWTGADLAGLTRFALSNAINRIMKNTLGQVEEKKIKVNQDDLKFGIKERCATKNSTVNKLEKYRSNVLVKISCVPPLSEACERVDQFAKKLWRCKSLHFLSCLLTGPSGCGKTTLAAHIVKKNGFKHVNMVQPESMIDFSEKEKSQKLVEIFEDALKFSSSLIILDDVERLVGCTEVGQYPKAISETLKCLLKKHVTEDIKVLVLGTTSEENVLEKIGISDVFTLQVAIPPLKDDDLKKILLELNYICNEKVIKAAVSKKISLKKLHLLINLMSNENEHDYPSGQKHIDEGDFLQYLSYINMSAGELAQGQAQAQAQATEREILTCDRERNSQLHDQQILELRSQISNLQSQIQALTEDFRSANLGVRPAAVATHVQPPMPPSQPSSSHNGEPMDTKTEAEGQPSSSRSCGKRSQASSSSEVSPDAFQIILERIDGLQDVQNEQSDRLIAIQKQINLLLAKFDNFTTQD